MPKNIVKRDGTHETWQPTKIEAAIYSALDSAGIINNIEEISVDLTERVLAKINGALHVDIEHVQDLVEEVLMESTYKQAARDFIKYREKRRETRDQSLLFFDVNEVIGDYTSDKDWRVKENSNMGKSFQGLTMTTNGAAQARFWLNKLPEEVRLAHTRGYFHIHDLSLALCGYCCGHSLYNILLEGFNKEDACSSSAPKHFDSALSQIINYIGTLQNEWSGAQGISSFDTLLAPLLATDIVRWQEELATIVAGTTGTPVKVEDLDPEAVNQYIRKRTKQSLQRFIFNLNTTSRWGGQTPFSNITFDIIPNPHYAKMPAIVGGKAVDKTYADFQPEMDLINELFVEVMIEGDANQSIFTFPIPTYNVTSKDFFNTQLGGQILEMTAKYGTPYFQNFINSDMNPEDVFSFCCRLSLDKAQVKEHLARLENKTGGLFGAGEMTGSIGVVTLNLAKLAFIAKNECISTADKDFQGVFFKYIKKYADLASIQLEMKRKMLNDNMARNMYPWTKRYLKHGFDSHFSTIGLVGGHEACLNLLSVGIDTLEGLQFMQKTLHYLRDLILSYQEETGNMYNLEATPAEGTSYRLAKIDKDEFPGIITSGTAEVPFYTNSTQLPVNHTSDPIEAIDHQNQLQPLYTGGTVFHTFIGEKINNPIALGKFIISVMENTSMPYISITPTFSICHDHGYFPGEHLDCPECHGEVSVFSRPVGYWTPTKRWNAGKQCEFATRKNYKV